MKVNPARKRVRYFLIVRNIDTEPSGIVRLCARKWPHGRLKLLGERCEARPSLDPFAITARTFKFKVRKRARGTLSKIRLRARGPTVEPVATTVWLSVRRRNEKPPDPDPYY